MDKKNKQSRCPNGSRRNPETGYCERKEDIAVKKFCVISHALKEKIKQVEEKKNIKVV